MNVSWTDPGSSLCEIFNYTVTFSEKTIVAQRSIQSEDFLCNKNPQSYVCKSTTSNHSTHQLSLYFKTNKPLSLPVGVLGFECFNWGQLANISVLAVNVSNATVPPSTEPSSKNKSPFYGGFFAAVAIILIVCVALYLRRMKRMR